jgi:hypothetical protein
MIGADAQGATDAIPTRWTRTRRRASLPEITGVLDGCVINPAREGRAPARPP